MDNFYTETKIHTKIKVGAESIIKIQYIFSYTHVDGCKFILFKSERNKQTESWSQNEIPIEHLIRNWTCDNAAPERRNDRSLQGCWNCIINLLREYWTYGLGAWCPIRRNTNGRGWTMNATCGLITLVCHRDGFNMVHEVKMVVYRRAIKITCCLDTDVWFVLVLLIWDEWKI